MNSTLRCPKLTVCTLSLGLLCCAQEASRTASDKSGKNRSTSTSTQNKAGSTSAPSVGCTPLERTLPAASSQRGKASYYHDSLAGNLTASGARYRLDRLTAAHRKLPFGTRLRVTRTDSSTAPTVCVTVNDRGPFAGNNRIIDLSRSAAEHLGMIRAGIVAVRIEILPSQGKGKK